jgi:hypothetical protein
MTKRVNTSDFVGLSGKSCIFTITALFLPLHGRKFHAILWAEREADHPA